MASLSLTQPFRLDYMVGKSDMVRQYNFKEERYFRVTAASQFNFPVNCETSADDAHHSIHNYRTSGRCDTFGCTFLC